MNDYTIGIGIIIMITIILSALIICITIYSCCVSKNEKELAIVRAQVGPVHKHISPAEANEEVLEKVEE